MAYVRLSLIRKQTLIELDEYNRIGLRDLFNFGHTFGHAIESYNGFHISHGQAVANGIGIANLISYIKGFITPKEYESWRLILEQFDNYSLAPYKFPLHVQDNMSHR